MVTVQAHILQHTVPSPLPPLFFLVRHGHSSFYQSREDMASHSDSLEASLEEILPFQNYFWSPSNRCYVSEVLKSQSFFEAMHKFPVKIQAQALP